jgi:hypothetical protein
MYRLLYIDSQGTGSCCSRHSAWHLCRGLILNIYSIAFFIDTIIWDGCLRYSSSLH